MPINDILGRPETFMGMRIIPSHFVQPVPKIQLSPKFEWCSPAFRAETNRWLLDRFGTKDVAYMFNGDFQMNPKQIAMLKNITV